MEFIEDTFENKVYQLPSNHFDKFNKKFNHISDEQIEYEFKTFGWEKENEDEFIDFDKMDNSQKLAFLTERNGYIEDGIGLNEYGHEFRDDNGQALFIDEQENANE